MCPASPPLKFGAGSPLNFNTGRVPRPRSQPRSQPDSTSFPSFPIRRRLKGREVASLIRDPVFLLAPDRRILHWNLAAARALSVEGLPAGDATVAESPRLARLAELLSHVDGPFMLTLDAPDGERTYLADLHEEGSDEDAPPS